VVLVGGGSWVVGSWWVVVVMTESFLCDGWASDNDNDNENELQDGGSTHGQTEGEKYIFLFCDGDGGAMQNSIIYSW